MKKYKKARIRRPILLSLAIALTFLVGSSILGIFWFQEEHIKERTNIDVDNVSRLLQTEIDEDSELLSAHLDFIEKDKTLRNAWLAKDRETLFSLSEKLFQAMNKKHKITHFYYMNTDRTCFLRVHNKSRYGDKINRHTMLLAEKTGKESSGIELGPLGTFTLRVVRPWRIDGKLVGYLELGEEINHIIPAIKDVLNVDIYLTINKKFLNRDMWEKGLKIMGNERNWDEFPHFVIIQSTTKQVPGGLKEYLKKLESCDSEEHLNSNINLYFKNQSFMGGFISLDDVSGKDLGDIIVLNNITKQKLGLKKLSILLIILGIITGSLLLAFFYIFIGLLQKKVMTAQKKLITEVQEREKAEERLIADEKELKKLNESLEQKVQERTSDLESAKELLEEKVERRTQDLQEKIDNIEKINKMLTGRELRIIELKKEINQLNEKLGKPKPYQGGTD